METEWRPNPKQALALESTAYEIGYTGVLRNRATVTAAVYWNNTDDGIYFTQVAKYTPANPPPTLPPFIPAAVLNFIPEPGLPSVFTYLNLGKVKDKGLELGIEGAVNRYLNVFTNYSYQADPIAKGFDAAEINFPANNRFNVGFNANYRRALGNLTVSYTDDAYWQDVLDRRFADQASVLHHDRFRAALEDAHHDAGGDQDAAEGQRFLEHDRGEEIDERRLFVRLLQHVHHDDQQDDPETQAQ